MCNFSQDISDQFYVQIIMKNPLKLHSNFEPIVPQQNTYWTRCNWQQYCVDDMFIVIQLEIQLSNYVQVQKCLQAFTVLIRLLSTRVSFVLLCLVIQLCIVIINYLLLYCIVCMIYLYSLYIQIHTLYILAYCIPESGQTQRTWLLFSNCILMTLYVNTSNVYSLHINVLQLCYYTYYKNRNENYQQLVDMISILLNI